MADTVNPQITDAVTQTNVKVLAEVPAQSMGVLYQVMAQTIALSMQNAVSAQQNMNTITSAAVATAVKLIVEAGTKP